jgi:hypothetical protein
MSILSEELKNELLDAPSADGWWVWINDNTGNFSDLVDCLMFEGGEVAGDWEILNDLGINITPFVEKRDNGDDDCYVSNYYEGCSVEYLKSEFGTSKFRKPTSEELADWKKMLLKTVPGI